MEEEERKAHPDVPAPSTALVKTSKETAALARHMAGKAADEEVYWCFTCGFADANDLDADGRPKVKYPKGLTLKFGEDEIEALGNDLSSYGGPCPVCNSMTLLPFDQCFGSETVFETARANRRQEYEEQADVFLDKAKQAAADVMMGSTLDRTPEERPAEDRPPGQRDDLPETGEADLDDLKGRTGE